jgi:hypothetical protein
MMEAVGSMSSPAGFHLIPTQGCCLWPTRLCCGLPNEKNKAALASFPWLGWCSFIDMLSAFINIFKFFLIFK